MIESKFNFRYILNEISYGALEKDKRILYIRDLLKTSMSKSIDDFKISNNISFDIYTKYKRYSQVKFLLKWDIKDQQFYDFNDKTTPAGAKISKIIKLPNDTYGASLIVNIHRSLGQAEEEYFEELNYLLHSNQLYQSISHEIKHMMDQIDEIFSYPEYFNPPKDDSDIEEYTKDMVTYTSQDKERDAQLISVLEELRHIKEYFSDIKYEQAIKSSERYKQFMRYIKPVYIKRYKQKIIYFWQQLEKGLA